ncbi:MAG TPA: hypothetical protein VJ724_04590 [Tahibacter sp.]|nr:hypothetical protein [Tahibacter sp.]
MRELFLIVRDILTFKRGPQDLPYAPNLTVVALALVIAVPIVVTLLDDGPLGQTLSRLVVSNGVPIGLVYLLLHARGFNGRFMQTLLAQTLTSIAFLAVAAPLSWLLGDLTAESARVMRPDQALPALLLLAAAFWKFLVEAHILRHALDIPFFAGVLVTILIGIANFIVMVAIFGERVVSSGIGV